MLYRIEVFDTWGRRVADLDKVPVLNAVRTSPDQPDRIHGMWPADMPVIRHGFTVRLLFEDRLVCQAAVTKITPRWGDTRKLILDRYVTFHEVVEFEGEVEACTGNTPVSRAYAGKEIADIVADVINSAPGSLHYYVDHAAYPDGAVRETQKFLARKSADNELSVGDISAGQWVGGVRLDASAAFVRDGDTIAGLVVDGAAWPDLRLMMIDCEELERNAHAIERHPEVADWTDAQYAASAYKQAADQAAATLQGLLDTKGIDYIELNPHRGADGAFDDRKDACGRYVGLAYGSGECFNAAMAELDVADIHLHEDGEFLVPEMALKEFFSYTGAHEASLEATGVTLDTVDVNAGALEALTVLAYAGDGAVWSIDLELGVRFRRPVRPDRVLFYDPLEMAVSLGSDVEELTNALYFEGDLLDETLVKTYVRDASVTAFGYQADSLTCFPLSSESDADAFVEGLLDDVAYPEPTGVLTFFDRDPKLAIGDLVELRGDALCRFGEEVPGEWGDQFTGRLIGRVRKLIYKLRNRSVQIEAHLTSPLRSVDDPLDFMVRSQPGGSTFRQFRLDELGVGLDLTYHLD